MKWEDYAADFDFDGSLRDIYVLETSLPDWQIFADFLRASNYKYTFHVAGEVTNFPVDIAKAFELRISVGALLLFEVGSVTLACHFFNDWEIEFDLDPREVKGEEQAELIFDFMNQLGRALNKEVVLTPENYRENHIFKFSPITQGVEYFPI